MNVILKSFDGPGCTTMIEEAFKDIPLETCIFVQNSTAPMAKVKSNERILIEAEPLREGTCPNIPMAPLDAEIVESMQECQAVFMAMIDRYAIYKDIPYTERKKQYLDHLRHWNHILNTKKIDLLLLNHTPHQCFDYVLYCLCKHKGIRTLHLERAFIIDAFFVAEDYQASAVELKDHLKKLQVEFNDPSKTIPLSPKFEEYITNQTEKVEKPYFTGARDDHLNTKSFIQKWSRIGIKMIFKKPGLVLSSILSPSFWHRKLKQHKAGNMYDLNTTQPDFNVKYIYVPLHMQPEETTCPMAGVFNDQDLIVKMLAAHLPKDVLIYVKEHPAQGELGRSGEFYQSMIDIPSVRFVPRSTDTFQLISNSIAVATATGTAGYEGLFRGKPAMIFGHRFYQYAPHVYQIHSNADCINALDEIVNNKKKPTLRDMRLFLKATQDLGETFVDGISSIHETRTPEERATAMGKKIREKICA